MKKQTLNAYEIQALLAERHKDDIFVSECKTGATWTGNHGRLDAWAMKKSWADPLTWGYEVKVARSDFLGDNKWHTYLPYCAEFYFVCPRDIIRPEEIPSEVGLIYAADTGNRLFTKKKAPRRKITIPEELYRYILMSRVEIVAPRGNHHRHPEMTREEHADGWRTWLANRQENRLLGYEVSKAVRQHVDAVIQRCAILEADNAALELFRGKLGELGVNVQQPVREWEVKRAVQQLAGNLPSGTVRDIDAGIAAMKRIKETISEGGLL